MPYLKDMMFMGMARKLSFACIYLPGETPENFNCIWRAVCQAEPFLCQVRVLWKAECSLQWAFHLSSFLYTSAFLRKNDIFLWCFTLVNT
jgi:hypothetical protein